MQRFTIICLLALTVSCAAPSVNNSRTVYFGGTIYTADSQQSVAEALVVEGQDIIFVGELETARNVYGDADSWVDLEGKFLMPGIHDAHIHPSLALEGETCRLPDQNNLDLQGIIDTVSECLEALGDQAPVSGGWITVAQFNGYGADSPRFLGNYPDIASGLDEISIEHKIILIGIDGHAYAVNHYALENGATLRGEHVRLTAESLSNELQAYTALIPLNSEGLPTGQLKSQAAWDLFKYESLSVEGFIRDYERVNEYFVSNGITAFTEAWASARDVAIYGGLARDGKLLPRATLALGLSKDTHVNEQGVVDLDALLDDLSNARARLADLDRVKVDGIKIFVDGVIEYPTQTAALHSNYLNAEIAPSGEIHYGPEHPQQRGTLELDSIQLQRVVTAVDAEDGVVHFHAIGDRAVSVALDAVASAREANGTDIPHNISHLQLVSESDVDRFGELKVFATPSPAWFIPWREYDASVIPYISEVSNVNDLSSLYREDSSYMQSVYPVESIRKAGGMISIGSDAPVDFNGPRPFTNIIGALLRADWIDETEETSHWTVLNASERMNIKDILDAYTINAARAMRHDSLTGSLEVGKRADFIVINNDLIALSDKISDRVNADEEQVAYELCDVVYDDSYCTTELLATFIDGKQVFGDYLSVAM
ncbi:MAG: amidohydrolase family protein [Gammaproteobacteria bacterium]|nr:amidohydrolase family protein [Gammaproteobacteria bacterium]